jgi:hypothetical protein
MTAGGVEAISEEKKEASPRIDRRESWGVFKQKKVGISKLQLHQRRNMQSRVCGDLQEVNGGGWGKG